MKIRRVTLVFLVSGSVALVSLLAGLVANVASSQGDWPRWLRPVESHPWQALFILGVAAVGLTALLAILPGQSDSRISTADLATSATVVPPGAAVVMRALPRDAASFTDREEEFRRVAAAVPEDGSKRRQGPAVPVPIHAIDGMPGVGKTTFAIHVGHLLADRFPDGQLFINLDGHTPGRRPIDPSDALASLLVADGLPSQQVPVGEDRRAVLEARAAVWRSRMAPRKELLIFDNVASFDQLEPLLPGGGACLVLVTSRRRLAAVDGITVEIDALSQRDAADLFVRLTGRGPGDLALAEVDEITQLCGCLPLAISVLAALLRHHSAWQLSDLRARLLAARNRLAEFKAGDRTVSAAFELSYSELSADRRRFFRLLGAFPGVGIEAHTAAALGATGLEKAQQQLDGLFDDHLLDETAGGRYRLHDLVREFSRSLSGDNDNMEQSEAAERLVEYYLAAFSAANALISRGGAALVESQNGAPVTVPTFGSRSAAVDWLESERGNVFACVDDANKRARYTAVIRLSGAMAPFLRQSGPWDQAAGLHRTAANAARQTADREAEAAALTELGVVYRLMASYPAAVRTLEDALGVYEEVSDRIGYASVLNQLGIVWYLTADYPAAADAQVRSLRWCREAGDLLGQANALADLGMVRRMTGDYAASVVAQTEALDMYRRLDDQYGQANSLRDLGIVHCLRGEYEKASRQHSEAWEIYRQLGDRLHQAYALNELGAVRRLLGDDSGAREAHTSAMADFVELGDRFGHANSLRYLGVLERLVGNASQALDAQRQALAIYRALGSRGGEAAALSEMGVLQRTAGDATQAESTFERALHLCRELGDRYCTAEVLNNWGLIGLGSDESLERFISAEAIAEDIRCPIEQARAKDGIGRCALSRGDRDAATAALPAALAAYRRLGAVREAAELAEYMTRQGMEPTKN